MRKSISHVAALILGGALTFGATTVIAHPRYGNIDTTPINEQILKENVELHVRLGELPTWNPSVVSANDLTAAYAAEATDKGVNPTTTNLFDALRTVAVNDGSAAVAVSSLSQACANQVVQ